MSWSFTSRTAWGKRVISLRGTGLEGSRNHRSCFFGVMWLAISVGVRINGWVGP